MLSAARLDSFVIETSSDSIALSQAMKRVPDLGNAKDRGRFTDIEVERQHFAYIDTPFQKFAEAEAEAVRLANAVKAESFALVHRIADSAVFHVVVISARA